LRISEHCRRDCYINCDVILDEDSRLKEGCRLSVVLFPGLKLGTSIENGYIAEPVFLPVARLVLFKVRVYYDFLWRGVGHSTRSPAVRISANIAGGTGCVVFDRAWSIKAGVEVISETIDSGFETDGRSRLGRSSTRGDKLVILGDRNSGTGLAAGQCGDTWLKGKGRSWRRTFANFGVLNHVDCFRRLNIVRSERA
jgi:hypothetical protein